MLTYFTERDGREVIIDLGKVSFAVPVWCDGTTPTGDMYLAVDDEGCTLQVSFPDMEQTINLFNEANVEQVTKRFSPPKRRHIDDIKEETAKNIHQRVANSRGYFSEWDEISEQAKEYYRELAIDDKKGLS